MECLTDVIALVEKAKKYYWDYNGIAHFCLDDNVLLHCHRSDDINVNEKQEEEEKKAHCCNYILTVCIFKKILLLLVGIK